MNPKIEPGKILAASWRFYIRNFIKMLPLTAILLAIQVTGTLVGQNSNWQIILLLLSLLAEIPLIYFIIALIKGEECSCPQAMGRSMPKFFPYIWVNIKISLLTILITFLPLAFLSYLCAPLLMDNVNFIEISTGAGNVFGAILGAFVQPWFVFAYVALFAEPFRVQYVTYSVELVKGNYWRVVTVTVITTALFTILSYCCSMAGAYTVLTSGRLNGVFGWMLTGVNFMISLLTGWRYAALAIAYFQLQGRKPEALDQYVVPPDRRI